MTNFFLLCLLIAPWVILPLKGITDQMRLPQLGFMEFTFLGMMCLYFRNGARFIYRNNFVFAFVSWISLHIFFFFFLPFSLNYDSSGRVLNTAILDPMLTIILGTIFCYIALTSFDREDFARIGKALCISGSLVAGFAILQFIGFDPFGSIAIYRCGNRVSACLDNPNLVSNYLVLCTPLYLMFDSARYKVGFFLAVIGIAVTRSDLGVLLFIIGMVTYLCINFSRWRYITAAMSVLIASFCTIYYKSLLPFFHEISDGRADCWSIALQKLKISPLLGQGLGVWKTFNVWIQTTLWTYVHNDWLEIAVQIGIIGVVLLILVLFNTFKNANYKDDVAKCYISSLVIFIVMMFGSFPFETSTIAMLGLVSWVAVERL